MLRFSIPKIGLAGLANRRKPNPKPAQSRAPVHTVIVDPNGEANLWRYDSALFNSLESAHSNRRIISSRDFKTGVAHESVLLRYYNYKRFRAGVLRGIFYLIGNLRSYAFLFRNRVRIAHFQWFKVPFIDWLGLVLLRLAHPSLKIVHTVHNVLPHDSGQSRMRGYRRLYHTVDALIVHTEATKNEIVETFGVAPAKIRVIPHGLLEITNPSPKKTDTAAVQTLLQGATRIVTILGMISPYKGHDRAIRAWTRSSLLRNPGWRLIIAGRGSPSYVEELERISGGCPNIRILNRFLDDEEFLELARRSHLALFPYRKISQSGALLSQIHFSTPFVAADVGGLADPLKIAEVGWKISDSDLEEGLKTLLDELGENDAPLLSRSRNLAGWRAITEHYSWPSIGRQTSQLYESLLSSEASVNSLKTTIGSKAKSGINPISGRPSNFNSTPSPQKQIHESS